MPTRADVFFNGGFYHIYNRNIEPLVIFSNESLNHEFIDTFIYYRSSRSFPRYSIFKKLKKETKTIKLKEVFYSSLFDVNILAFVLMSNHYHFLIKQLKTKGVINFMAKTINSITRFYNSKSKRKGPVFLPQFRSRRILSIEQLVYTSRYIHTNIYAHGQVTDKKEIFSYPYSSISAYLEEENILKIDTIPVLSYFNGNKERYKKFIINNAEDQKASEMVKYTKRWY